MEVFTGRPANGSGRDEVELRCYDLLDQLGIEYIRTDHAPADTMEICKDIDAVLDCLICKNLFLCNRQKTSFYLVTMYEDKPFSANEVGHQIGSSRLSFAPPELMEELIRCAPGSASVLGLAYDTEHQVTFVMDREVYESELFACHPCRNDGSLRLKTADLLEKFLPHTGHAVTVVDLPHSI